MAGGSLRQILKSEQLEKEEKNNDKKKMTVIGNLDV